MKKIKIGMPALDSLQRYSIDEAQAYLRASRAKLYKMIATGDILTLKEGRRRFVPGSEIARLSAAP